MHPQERTRSRGRARRTVRARGARGARTRNLLTPRAPLFCGLLALICGTCSASAHGLGTVGKRVEMGQKPAEIPSIWHNKSTPIDNITSPIGNISTRIDNKSTRTDNMLTSWVGHPHSTAQIGMELRTAAVCLPIAKKCKLLPFKRIPPWHPSYSSSSCPFSWPPD